MAEKKKIDESKNASKNVEKQETSKEDFKYIVRISDTDINGEKKVLHALTKIRGIGLHLSTFIVDTAGIDRNKKIGDLSDSQIEKLQSIIDVLSKQLPSWMVNRRKDYYTGKNLHLVGADIAMTLREDINKLKKIRAYRGIRHELGLPVRGQRTRANNRKGLSLGVSRKRPQ